MIMSEILSNDVYDMLNKCLYLYGIYMRTDIETDF